MRNLPVFLATLTVLSISACVVHAQELATMVRDLNEAQDRAVLGDMVMAKDLTKRYTQIEQFLPSIGQEEWRRLPNLRAAAVYLLCGGSPQALRKLFSEHVVIDNGAPLIEASLAYAEGRKEVAGRLLSTIDVESLPTTLAGHVSLVRGGLLIGSNKKRATYFFDRARLLMPGTLIEEAALRRELSILSFPAEIDRYLSLGRRYVQTFSQSPFAKHFWNQLNSVLTDNAPSLNAARLTNFAELLEKAERPARFELDLALARVGILNGRLDIAKAMIEKAAPLAVSENDRERLKLYTAAVKLEDGDFASSTFVLRKIDVAALSRQEIDLLKIASDVGARLSASASGNKVVAGTTDAVSPEVGRETTVDAALVDAVRQSLADSELLLRKAEKQ